jgi:hypothetical protein
MRPFVVASLVVLLSCAIFFGGSNRDDAPLKAKSHPNVPLPANPHIKPPHPEKELLFSVEEIQFWEREHAPGAKLFLKPDLPFSELAPVDLGRYLSESDAALDTPPGSLLADCMEDLGRFKVRGVTSAPQMPGCAHKLAAAAAAGQILEILPGSIVEVIQRKPKTTWVQVSLLRSGLHNPTSAVIRRRYVWMSDPELRTSEEVKLGEGER